MADQIKTLHDLASEIWNTGDLSRFDEVFAPNFVNHDPSRPDVVDSESIKAFIAEIRKGMPDFEAVIEDTITENNMMVIRWVCMGTQKGTSTGLPATGKHATYTGMTISRLEQGKIVETWWNYDTLYRELNHWEATQWLCIMDYDPSHMKMWETENTGHGRNGYQWSFGGREEEGYGPMLSIVNWDLNLNTNEGVTWGVWQHDIFDDTGNWLGAWIGTYAGKLTPADSGVVDIFGNPVYLAVGKTEAYGIGAFEGMQHRTNYWQEAYDPGEVPNPCNEVFNPDGTFPYQLPMLPVMMHVEGSTFMGD
jgi:steroid delta-isomerase-like uncharacterized protein